MDNKDKNWARYGMHVVNASLNRRPSRAKANYSPNQIFYGKKNDKKSVYSVLGHSVVKMAETEAGLEAAYNAVQNANEPISNESLEKIIRDADAQFLQELRDEGVLIDGEDKDSRKTPMMTTKTTILPLEIMICTIIVTQQITVTTVEKMRLERTTQHRITWRNPLMMVMAEKVRM
jgi:hypothetical protein